MTTRQKKSAFVHEAQQHDANKYTRPEARNWDEDLQSIQTNKTLDERKINGFYFEPVKIKGRWLLGIHKPLDSAFMTRIDHGASSVSDLMADDDDQGMWAHSSAVFFSNTHHVFAIVRGDTHAPGANAVKTFLDRFFEPETPDYHWKIAPYMDDGQLSRLKEAKGLVKFSTRFSTQRDLFDSADGTNGITGYLDKLADKVGQDLEVSIELRLPKHSHNKRAQGRFLSVAKEDLKRTATPESKAQAKAVINDELVEELSLVSHRLATEFELPEIGSEKKQFSDLLNGLDEVRDELNARIQIIEKG